MDAGGVRWLSQMERHPHKADSYFRVYFLVPVIVINLLDCRPWAKLAVRARGAAPGCLV